MSSAAGSEQTNAILLETSSVPQATGSDGGARDEAMREPRVDLRSCSAV